MKCTSCGGALDGSHLDNEGPAWMAADSIFSSGGDLLPDAGGVFVAIGGMLGSLFD